MESLNAHFINEGMQQQERLNKLNTIAIAQMKTLVDNKQVKKLKGGKNGIAS